MKHWIALPLAAWLLTHCGENSDAESKKTTSLTGDIKSSIPDVGTIIIDLPSAVAPVGSELHLNANDGLQQLFLIPVKFTGVAEQMTTLTKSVIEHIFGKAVCVDDDSSNDTDDCAEYRGIIAGEIAETATVFEIPGERDEDSPSHVKYWANPAGSDYDVGLELYWPADAGYVAAMQMQLSKTGDKQGRGEMTFFPNFDGSSGPSAIVTKFSATASEKTMDVQLYAEADDDGPSSLGLSVTDKDGVISGSGTAIRPEQSADSGNLAPFQTKAEFAYVYTLAADATNNIAVEKLAFVPATAYANESSYFAGYGVDSILKNFAIDLLRTSSTNFNCATSGQYISTALPANICQSNTAVTDAAVLSGLTNFCTNNPGNSNICLIAGQVSRWSNPVYLDAEGYVGNESYQKPGNAAYAPLVTKLADITLTTPTAFKALTKPELPDAVDTVE